MPAALEFLWDSRQLEVFGGRLVDQALTRALRLAGNQGIRVTQRESLAFYKTQKAVVRDNDIKAKNLPLSLPRRSDSINDLVWEMRAANLPISVAKFQYLDTRQRGVFARINLGKGTSRIAAAFVIQMKGGHAGVFMRKGRARFPIRKLGTSSMSDVLRDSGGADAALAAGYAKLEKAWPKGMERELGKLRRKGLA